MYILASKHVVADRDVDDCKRCVCYSLDRCIEQIDPATNPNGTISIIFDLRGAQQITIERTIQWG